MIAGVKRRVLRLEENQPKQQFCWPLSYFYGQPAQPETLVIGQTLSNFYQSLQKDQQHGK